MELCELSSVKGGLWEPLSLATLTNWINCLDRLVGFKKRIKFFNLDSTTKSIAKFFYTFPW